ncbi:MAG: hypothetical protein IT324_06615 [Anaerolineae bacterium]|nr:hypothetical protein [Anaerolineae bacterium]
MREVKDLPHPLAPSPQAERGNDKQAGRGLPRRVLLVLLLLIALTTLPYIVGILSAPAGTQFSGVIIDAPDYNSHLAKMQQGLRGAWRYQLLFTAEPHEPIFLQTFYVALGHVARWTGLSLGLTYHLAQIICIALMVLALWGVMTHFLPEDRAWWALLLCLFGGGMSYLLLLVPGATADISPIEFWFLDAYIVLVAFTLPHLTAAVALLALLFATLDKWTQGSSPRSLLVLFVAALALALIQPFHLLLFDPVLILVTLWRAWRKQLAWRHALAGLALVGISHAAVVGYDWLVLNYLPVWQSFTQQNITLSPPPIFYLLGYLPTLLPALGGIWLAIRRRNGQLLVPILWLALVAALIYAPLLTQRRFVLGVQAPLAVLAIYWLAEAAVPWLRKRLRRRYRFVLLLYGTVASLSTIAVMAWLITAARNPANRDSFVSGNTRATWNWINTQTPDSSVILSAFSSGGQIAAQTGRRVVLGHWIETADYLTKRDWVQQFFTDATSDDWRMNLLRNQRAAYVWYGPEERSLGAWNPANASYLRFVYQQGDVTLFLFVDAP